MTTLYTKLQPLLNRVLVQKVKPITKSAGGIILADESQTNTNVGTIVAVGPGALDQNGNLLPLSVSVGQTVLLPEYGGTKVELQSQELYIYRDSDIIGLLEKH